MSLSPRDATSTIPSAELVIWVRADQVALYLNLAIATVVVFDAGEEVF